MKSSVKFPLSFFRSILSILFLSFCSAVAGQSVTEGMTEVTDFYLKNPKFSKSNDIAECEWNDGTIFVNQILDGATEIKNTVGILGQNVKLTPGKYTLTVQGFNRPKASEGKINVVGVGTDTTYFKINEGDTYIIVKGSSSEKKTKIRSIYSLQHGINGDEYGYLTSRSEERRVGKEC